MAAPTLTVQDIKDFAPELANVGDTRIQIWIDDCPLNSRVLARTLRLKSRRGACGCATS